jgi:hypothetical protein
MQTKINCSAYFRARRRHQAHDSAGKLSCENCSSASIGAGGEFHLFVQPSADWNPALTRPMTAAERAEQRKERFSILPLGQNRLEHHSSREAVSLGPLLGYAVLDGTVGTDAAITATFSINQ